MERNQKIARGVKERDNQQEKRKNRNQIIYKVYFGEITLQIVNMLM